MDPKHEATIRELMVERAISAPVGALNRPECAATVERGYEPSRWRQYELLAESAANPVPMCLDELHLAHPFHGSRQLARHLHYDRVVAGLH